MILRLILLLVCMAFERVFTLYGADLDALVILDSFECLKKSRNHQFAIISVGSSGKFDFFAPVTIHSAEESAINVDLQIELCLKCGSSDDQVANLTSWIKSKNIEFHTLWINFEKTKLWSVINTENIQFLEQLKVSLARHSIKWGIRTSKVAWEESFGDYYKGASSLPLWETYYDGIPSFSGFITFGGWLRPTMKRYLAESEGCEVEFGANWRMSIE